MDADLVNLPLPPFDEYTTIYLKDSDSTHVVKGGCVKFHENNYIIQNQVFFFFHSYYSNYSVINLHPMF